MNPFFIIGLPRSRTAWLSVFLSSGPSTCFHEAVGSCSPQNVLHDLKAVLQSNAHPHRFTGDSDSALPLFWPRLSDVFPRARYVFVDRPFNEAFASHRKAFPCFDEERVKFAFDGICRGIEAMKQDVEDSITVNYDQLDEPHICNYIWEFCVPGAPFDFERSEMLQALRINQIHDKVVERCHPKFAERILACHHD